MKYLKAKELDRKPFIQFDLWANSFEELQAMGEDENPLIMAEDDIPDFVFGVHPFKIEAGEIVERTTLEMEAFEAEWNLQNVKNENSKKLREINQQSFTYDSTDFPMDEVSRLFYLSLEKNTIVGDVKCMTMAGELYNLANANVGDFLTKFYKKLKGLSQPPV